MSRRIIDERDALRRTVARQDERIRALERAAGRAAALEREEEGAVEAMHQIADDTPGSEAGDVFRAFYRAIRDGKIPGIKLEDAS